MPDADVQIVMQGSSGLPEDRFINTLHFSQAGIGSFSVFAEELAIGLPAAWNPCGLFIPSPPVNRKYEIRIYDPGQPEPRKPWRFGTTELPTGTLASAGLTQLPSEVACCLSYYGVSNTKRNRGRIYLGPLAVQNMTDGRPDASLRTQLLDLATRLSNVGTEMVDWQIVSRVAGTRQRIQEVWVDNAYDTQRRRGLAPQNRVTRAVSG